MPLGGYFRHFRDLYLFPVLFPKGNRLVLNVLFFGASVTTMRLFLRLPRGGTGISDYTGKGAI